MNNQQINVAKAILSESSSILVNVGFAAYADESLAGSYVLVYLNGDNLTITSSLSQTGHTECTAFPTFSEETVLQWANLDECEEVEIEELVSDYVAEVYVPEQRLRLETMLEAATA